MANFDLGALIAKLNGIKFPTVQVPSADVNTLDDYEEGTFTPGLTFNGASVGLSMSVQSATYTKIGNRVLFTINLNLSAKGSSTGAVRITGLPFTANLSLFSVATLRFHALSSPPTMLSMWALIDAGNTTMQLVYLSAAGSETNFTDAHLGNTTSIIVTGQYYV
jgi:hypothetical protein